MIITLVFLTLLFQAPISADDVKTMPNSCNDLLPEIAPYIELFDQTAQLLATQSPQKAKKMFNLLALRTMHQEVSGDYNNPIDWFIKDSICECSERNKGELFNSTSKELVKCLDKHLSKFTKKAEKEYIKLKLENYKKDKALKLTEQQMITIEALREQASKDMKVKTDVEFNKKIRN